MSTDAYDVKIRSIDGRRVVLDILPSNYDDLVVSRSFALHLLADALERSCDLLPGAWDDPVKQAERSRRRAKSEAAPLVVAMSEHRDWFVDGAWIAANVPKFIERVELLERRNAGTWEELSVKAQAIEAKFPQGFAMDRYAEWGPLQWGELHNYTLAVTVTDAKWAEHLEPGLLFGSTAADWERETGVKLG